MGMWVTTGNISRLLAKLDWKFGDVGLARVRAHPARVQRFSGTLRLHRIARLFRVWPGGPNASGSQTALYWYGFLRWLHSQQNAATGNSYVADDIIAYMSAAIGDHTNCLAIKFIAINGDDVRVTEAGLSAPTNANPNAYIQTILLQTVDHGTDSESEPSSTGQDPPGEDVPDPSATARVKAGYRSNKKVAKKKAAKKKAPKKKAAKKKK